MNIIEAAIETNEPWRVRLHGPPKPTEQALVVVTLSTATLIACVHPAIIAQNKRGCGGIRVVGNDIECREGTRCGRIKSKHNLFLAACFDQSGAIGKYSNVVDAEIAGQPDARAFGASTVSEKDHAGYVVNKGKKAGRDRDDITRRLTVETFQKGADSIRVLRRFYEAIALRLA